MGFKNIHNHIIRDNLGSESRKLVLKVTKEKLVLFFNNILNIWASDLLVFLLLRQIDDVYGIPEKVPEVDDIFDFS